jgi:leucyl-tRNA synthetase
MVIRNGAKMSKSLGNVVPADEVAEKFGADTARLFALFAAPPEKDVDWIDTGIEGISRFLGRIYRYATRNIPAAGGDGSSDARVLRKLHQTLRKITEDFDSRWHFNTSIAAIMELINEMYAEESRISAAAMAQALEILTLLIAPFAPYLAQELWEEQGHSGPVFKEAWPAFDEALARESELEIPVQINGKNRARIVVAPGLESAALQALALADGKIKSLIDGKTVVKVIAVPDKLVNVVVK